MPNTHRLAPQQSVLLPDLPTSGKLFHTDRTAAEAEFAQLRKELVDWQYRLYAEHKQKLLVVLQAMDAGGKDGTIRKIFKGVNPQGVRVASFKAPSSAELSRDFLWRIHQEVPRKGHIRIFNRSQYEDVLVVRVENIVPESVWRPRYEMINHFEKMLTLTGTRVLKFYLHISPEEQLQRLRDRLIDPTKNWKFSSEDLKKREDWDDYMGAYGEMLANCSTEHAPWYIIPSDQKWYRNLAITRVIVDTLRQMDPQFPPSEEGIESIHIK